MISAAWAADRQQGLAAKIDPLFNVIVQLTAWRRGMVAKDGAVIFEKGYAGAGGIAHAIYF